MEILYFSLGATTVALGYAVVGVFKLNKRFKRTSVRARKGINHLERSLDDLNDRVDRDIEGVYRTIDSRLDKLEHRLANN